MPEGKVRVAVVDDNPIMQQIMVKTLHKYMHIEIQPEDVFKDGLSLLKALTQRRYDLILLDIEMPIMDGLQATIRIRNPAENPEHSSVRHNLQSNNSGSTSSLSGGAGGGGGSGHRPPTPSPTIRQMRYALTSQGSGATTSAIDSLALNILDVNRRVPIIAVTANAFLDQQRRHCLSVGFDDVVSKPISPDQIKHIMSRYLDADPDEHVRLSLEDLADLVEPPAEQPYFPVPSESSGAVPQVRGRSGSWDHSAGIGGEELPGAAGVSRTRSLSSATRSLRPIRLSTASRTASPPTIPGSQKALAKSVSRRSTTSRTASPPTSPQSPKAPTASVPNKFSLYGDLEDDADDSDTRHASYSTINGRGSMYASPANNGPVWVSSVVTLKTSLYGDTPVLEGDADGGGDPPAPPTKPKSSLWGDDGDEDEGQDHMAWEVAHHVERATTHIPGHRSLPRGSRRSTFPLEEEESAAEAQQQRESRESDDRATDVQQSTAATSNGRMASTSRSDSGDGQGRPGSNGSLHSNSNSSNLPDGHAPPSSAGRRGRGESDQSFSISSTRSSARSSAYSVVPTGVVGVDGLPRP
ncbi:hypothetical protein HKX48_000052, partial [Thoreauomyces humboldtii]